MVEVPLYSGNEPNLEARTALFHVARRTVMPKP